MSQMILDTSVIVAWLLADEPSHLAALAIRQDIIDRALEPVLAMSTRFEIRNAMVRAARRVRVSWERALASIAAVDDLELRVSRHRPADPALLAICRAYGVGWGDAIQVSLAQRLGAPLITADQRLVSALRDSPVWVESILDRPIDAIPGDAGPSAPPR